MTFRKVLKSLLPFAVIVIPAFIAFYMVNSKPVKQQPVPREKVWQVDVMPVLRQSLSPTTVLYGHVESPDLLKAAAPGAGIVASVNVRSGDIVATGDVLVSLDRRDFRTERILARAELADLESQISELEIRHQSNVSSLQTERELLILADQEVARMRQLKKQNLGSETTLSEALNAQGRQQLALQNRQLEVDSFPANLKMLESRQDQAEARLAEAELKLQRGSVVAPFDGVISAVPVSVGDRVSTGDLLTSLYPLNSLEIRAHITNDFVDSIRVAIARGEIVQATLRSRKNVSKFKLLRLSGEAEATGIDAYFASAETDHDFRPGELLALTLSLPAVDDAIAVPFQAIYGNSRIYVIRENRLVGIDVETIGQFQDADAGNNAEAKLLIRSDSIKPDDRIVVTHLPNAVTGLKVRTAADASSKQ